MIFRSPRLFPHVRRPLIFGHRGYSAIAPENTLASFQKLLEHGIPGVEFDVHLCKTGELVVIHDSKLKRITGAEGTVEGSSHADLAGLDAGAWYSTEFKGEKIPLLSEVFELLGKNVYYDIEIKQPQVKDSGISGKLIAMIREYGLEDRVVISSFNPFAIAPFRKSAPDIPTAIIYSHDRELPFFFRRGEGRLISHSTVLKPERTIINPWNVFLDKTIFGYNILSWTVNSLEEGARLLEIGTEGLISDDPGKLMPLLTPVL